MGTRCNASHCAWRDALCLPKGETPLAVACGNTLERVDVFAWRRDVPELRVRVGLAGGDKGLGVFAAQSAGPGRWVCSYVGEFLELIEVAARYSSSLPVYVYSLGSGGGAIDARDSRHFSRLVNHHEDANLHAVVDGGERRIDFYAKRPLSPGVELTIDYGTSYWRARSTRPAAGTESRWFGQADASARLRGARLLRRKRRALQQYSTPRVQCSMFHKRLGWSFGSGADEYADPRLGPCPERQAFYA